MCVVVISHYAPRGVLNLKNLIWQLLTIPPGEDYKLCIVSNVASHNGLKIDLNERIKSEVKNVINEVVDNAHHSNMHRLPLEIIHMLRENTGMNIGAWEHGWRRCTGSSHFLFLQDEVKVIKPMWLSAYTSLEDVIKERYGDYLLIGESWNRQWDMPWDKLMNTTINVPAFDHPPNIGRVAYYYKYLATNLELSLGGTAGHLRSLIWYTNRKTLEEMDGFFIGENYPECIISEIAASMKVMSIGGKVGQVRPNPFEYFWHPEWRPDGVSKIF